MRCLGLLDSFLSLLKLTPDALDPLLQMKQIFVALAFFVILLSDIFSASLRDEHQLKLGLFLGAEEDPL